MMGKLFDNKDIWMSRRVSNSKNIEEGFFITYVVDRDTKGIIKPQADKYELEAS